MVERFELNVAGCTIRVDAHGPAWAGAVADLAAGWRDQPPGPSAGRVVCGAGGDGRTLDVGLARVRTLDDHAIAVDGHPAPVALDHALPVALAWVLAAQDRWIVHGAGVVPPEASGALIATGPAGAGKSTTAAAALAAGWPVLADDLLVVRPGPGAPAVTGVPRPLAVPPDVGAHLGRPLGGDPRGRRAVDAELAGGWHPIAAVLVLGHGDHAATEAVRIRAVDAVRALTTAHFPAAIDGRMRSWFPVAARLARLPAWRLDLGADPADRLAGTAAALRAVAAVTGTAPAPTPR